MFTPRQVYKRLCKPRFVKMFVNQDRIGREAFNGDNKAGDRETAIWEGSTWLNVWINYTKLTVTLTFFFLCSQGRENTWGGCSCLTLFYVLVFLYLFYGLSQRSILCINLSSFFFLSFNVLFIVLENWNKSENIQIQWKWWNYHLFNLWRALHGILYTLFFLFWNVLFWRKPTYLIWKWLENGSKQPKDNRRG